MGEMTPEVVATIARLLSPAETKELLEKVFVLKPKTPHCRADDPCYHFGCTLDIAHEGPHAAHGMGLLTVWTDDFHWHYTDGFARR